MVLMKMQPNLCLSANSMWCQEVHIFADNDSNYTGQSKAYILANRIEVQYKLKAIVHIPPTADIDYNDIHREALKADAALFKIVK